MSAALMMLACSWHVGRAPARIEAARPRVEAPAMAEPGLHESLERALAGSTSRRLDPGRGPELVLRVESVEVVSSASGQGLAREARMELSLGLLTEAPEFVRVSGVQSFTGADPLQLEAARRQALDELSERLVEEAVQRLLVVP